MHEFLPVYMCVLYQCGPMTDISEGGLSWGWVIILAIIELVIYIRGKETDPMNFRLISSSGSNDRSTP